ncbi:NAD-dependent deacetylase [Chloroflexota bacterium]
MNDLIENAAQDLTASNYAIALTGAGISTESGLPDFRGPSGLWTKRSGGERKPRLGFRDLLSDPVRWWIDRLSRPISLMGDLMTFQPNTGHLALAELERMDVLKCVITQNIDGLHTKAGSKHVLEYHGNSLKLRCIECEARYDRNEYDLEGLQSDGRLPPKCKKCGGLIKTDGVGFGEPIPEYVASASMKEAMKCDLMLICGTSAVVYPFANLPRIAINKHVYSADDTFDYDTPLSVTVIEVNAEPTPLTEDGTSDYIIEGKIGEILPAIAERVKELKG